MPVPERGEKMKKYGQYSLLSLTHWVFFPTLQTRSRSFQLAPFLSSRNKQVTEFKYLLSPAWRPPEYKLNGKLASSLRFFKFWFSSPFHLLPLFSEPLRGLPHALYAKILVAISRRDREKCCYFILPRTRIDTSFLGKHYI